MKRSFIAAFSLIFLSFSGAYAQVAAYDVLLESLSTRTYARPGDLIAISGVIRNMGTEVLTRVKIHWQEDDGMVHTWEKTGMNLVKSIRTDFEHPEPLFIDGMGDKEIKVWTSDPNGHPDEKPRTDTLTMTVQVVETFPPKNFLIEQITGSWCGYCPRAPIIYNKVVEPVYPNSILVAIHTGDPMEIAEAAPVMNAYVSGVPCGFVNRMKPGDFSIAMAPEQWKDAMDLMDPDFTPAELNLYNYFDLETGEWKIDLVVDFIIDFSGDLRLNCYVVEDSVTGSGTDWQQRNYFNGGAFEPYLELQGAGDPIPGYKFNHVVRKMLGGSWGKSGVIPASVKRGDRYVWSSTFTASQNWRVRNLSLVGILQVYGSSTAYRPVLNAVKTDLAYKTGVETPNIPVGVHVYPNPASDRVWVEVTEGDGRVTEGYDGIVVELFDLQGRRVRDGEMGRRGDGETGRRVIEVGHLERGIYFVKVRRGQEFSFHKILISK